MWERVCVWCGVYSVESCLLCGLATKLSPSRSHTRSPEAVDVCLLCVCVCVCVSRCTHLYEFFGATLLFPPTSSTHMCAQTHRAEHTHTESGHKHTTKSSIIFRYFSYAHNSRHVHAHVYTDTHTKTHCSCLVPSGFISVFVSVSHTLKSSGRQQLFSASSVRWRPEAAATNLQSSVCPPIRLSIKISIPVVALMYQKVPSIKSWRQIIVFQQLLVLKLRLFTIK